MKSFHLALFECHDILVECQNFLYSNEKWILIFRTEGVYSMLVAVSEVSGCNRRNPSHIGREVLFDRSSCCTGRTLTQFLGCR
jgi:hypothetical protein